MDKNRFSISKTLLVCSFVLGVTLGAFNKHALADEGRLRRSLAQLEARYPDQIGVYIKDLESGQTVSLHADEFWYLASGIKLPIAITVLQNMEQNLLSLDKTKIRLAKDDYLDGAGGTNHQPVGALLSIRYLLEQMMIYSDNTASDLLIRHVGLESVNQLIEARLSGGFTKITRLSDVRRNIYSAFHPSAYNLTNPSIKALKDVSGQEKVIQLARLLHVNPAEFKVQSLDAAYSTYYSKRVNSGKLSAYGDVLEQLVTGKLFNHKETTELLLDIMARVETGKNRIRAEFPKDMVFAHKTGTQHKRICDFGIAWNKSDSSKQLVIAACARGFATEQRAEAALRDVGKAVSESDVFGR